MSLSAGRLRQRVTIQSPVGTPDGGGGNVRTWSSVTTVGAEVLPVNGGEAFRAGIANATQFYRVTIRFREDVTPIHRLLWKGTPLNIRTIGDPTNRREELLITAESGVASG